MIPFNRPALIGNELDLITQSVRNGHISGNGPFTIKAEKLLTEITSARHALLTTNCTHALELAARVLRLGPGDEVIVPAFTFVSTAAAIALTGARPVFVDVTPQTLNLNPNLVEQSITPNTKAVFTVHYAGIGEKVDQLAELCNRNGIPLIEDNAHGLGGTFRDKALGTFGAMSTLSFHETKNITCGEGGALTLNSPDYLESAEILREKGTNRARFLRGQVDKYTWVDVGSSWVASDILAAYLVAQLERFESIQTRRHEIWNSYNNELNDWATNQGVRLPQVPAQAGHSAHMFYLHLQNVDVRARFIEHMKEKGVMTVFHYQALNTSEVGQNLGGIPGQCPVSEAAAQTLVRLPLFVDLRDAELAQITSAVKEFETKQHG